MKKGFKYFISVCLMAIFFLPFYATANASLKEFQGNMSADEMVAYIGFKPTDFKQTIDIENSGLVEHSLLGIAEEYTSDYIYTYLVFHTALTYQNTIPMNISIKIWIDNEKYILSDMTAISDIDFNEQDYMRTSSQDKESKSKGISVIRFQHYKKADISKTRKYFVEKVLYDYQGKVNGEYNFAKNFTPSYYKNYNVDGSVDDGFDGFADIDYTVKQKSIICTKVIANVENKKAFFGFTDQSIAYISMQELYTGKKITNAKILSAYFTASDEKIVIDRDISVYANGSFNIGNIFSRDGELENASKTLKKASLDKFGIDCNYTWMWNYKISDLHFMYVYYEVEANSVVRGSFYKDGWHVEYNKDGTVDGVYDKNGNLVEDKKGNSLGQIFDKEGNIIHPANEDITYHEDEEKSFTDIIKMIFSVIGFIIGAYLVLKAFDIILRLFRK